MAQVVTRPQRFTPEEWKIASKIKHKNAERDRAAAERLILESDRLDSETREQSDTTLEDVDKKIDQRLNDVKYWKNELESKLDGIFKEIDVLEAFKRRVEKAIEAVQEPLHIAQTCLANREKRYDIDLVHDNVQKELIKEVEIETGANALLIRLLEQVKEQLRLNRKARYNLENDIKNKFNAESIDSHVQNLTLTSPSLYLKNGAAKIEPNSYTEQQWENFSDVNIKSAEATRLNSVQLRNVVDSTLQQTANDMQKQIELTNRAIERRIWEEKDSKAKLEEQCKDVTKLIDTMEENIKNVEKAILDKENYLKLAHTRLDIRTNRPEIELVRDPAQYKMVKEVHEIEDSIRRLQERLNESHKKLKDLDRNKLLILKDIDVKTNTIRIDEAENFNGIRKSLKINQF
ncbi:Tektin-1 [Brachionus plicatilis]|uniref:Tektin n=1 Tax=Brachionus plicatilis TaxID=10195 RepID=A0A3M7SGF8_BRAPC|nr:Tektin-1 [Brachionus plicatilis]